METSQLCGVIPINPKKAKNGQPVDGANSVHREKLV